MIGVYANYDPNNAALPQPSSGEANYLRTEDGTFLHLHNVTRNLRMRAFWAQPTDTSGTLTASESIDLASLWEATGPCYIHEAQEGETGDTFTVSRIRDGAVIVVAANEDPGAPFTVTWDDGMSIVAHEAVDGDSFGIACNPATQTGTISLTVSTGAPGANPFPVWILSLAPTGSFPVG